MAELGRRLRLAVSAGREALPDSEVRPPWLSTPPLEPQTRRPAPVRPSANPSPAAPAPVETPVESAPSPATSASGDDPSDAGAVAALPSVEELASRLPAEARTALEELFRAKWTKVKRLRPEDLGV